MSITDELRSFARDMDFELTLTPIADRIDAQHKQAIDKAHADGERNGLQQARSVSEDWRRGFDAGFSSGIDDWLADHEDAMVEHGWVKLPVDADGVPIRIGDVIQNVDYNDSGSVYEMRLDDDNWFVYVNGVGRRPERYRHREPTTEDVLRELLDRWCSESGNRKAVELVAEYAQRLQLKEMDE